jgi:hypothetical protein
MQDANLTPAPAVALEPPPELPEDPHAASASALVLAIVAARTRDRMRRFLANGA